MHMDYSFLDNVFLTNHNYPVTTGIDTSCPPGYEKLIPVVFAANDNYSIYAAVAIESILKNASAKDFYRIYILYDELTQEHIDGLEGIKSSQAVVRCINIRQLISEKAHLFFSQDYISKETYYRFYIPELFPCFEKVIYLDCDLVVCSDLAELISVDMGENYIAAVRDYTLPEYTQHLNETFDLAREKYINSGVLLIDTKKWKENGVFEKIFSARVKYPTEKLLWADQDLLNVVCKNKIYYLGDEWNFFGSILSYNRHYAEIFAERIKNVVDCYKILHFPAQPKPWSAPELPFSEKFWAYAATSVFFMEIICKEFGQMKNSVYQLHNQNNELRNQIASAEKNARDVKEYYENTTCWRITKPVRVLGDISKKLL